LLEIKLLQNALYGRLRRRSCGGGRPWVRWWIWRKPD